MKIKIPIETLDNYKNRDLIPLECENCKSEFNRPKNEVIRALKGTPIAKFCSRKCAIDFRGTKYGLSHICPVCKKQFTRPSSYSHGKVIYCSKKCSASIVNKMKIKQRSNCPNCGKIIQNLKSKFCCRECAFEYSHKNRTLERFNKGLIKTRGTLSIILIKLRGNKCEICSNENWLGEPIKLQVHHIDGNPSNDMPLNLQLVCPNCHSFTDSYGGKNKGNGRKSLGLSLG